MWASAPPSAGSSARWLEAFVPSVIGVMAPQAAATGNLLHSGMEHPGKKSVLESLMEVADLPELFFDPAVLDSVLERCKNFK